jgi:hypothetical protein
MNSAGFALDLIEYARLGKTQGEKSNTNLVDYRNLSLRSDLSRLRLTKQRPGARIDVVIPIDYMDLVRYSAWFWHELSNRFAFDLI